jgi:hypothetical protein
MARLITAQLVVPGISRSFELWSARHVLTGGLFVSDVWRTADCGLRTPSGSRDYFCVPIISYKGKKY